MEDNSIVAQGQVNNSSLYKAFVDRLLGSSSEEEPGYLAFLAGCFLVAGTVSAALNLATRTFMTWRVLTHCLLSYIACLVPYSRPAHRFVVVSRPRILLGKPSPIQTVTSLMCLYSALRHMIWISSYLDYMNGLLLTMAGIYGVVILGESASWYSKNHRFPIQTMSILLLVGTLTSYLVISLIPMRFQYFEPIPSSQIDNTPRLSVNVILGGQEARVESANRSGTGTVCFYVPPDTAVIFAHKVPRNPLTGYVPIKQLGKGPQATVTANTHVGVVLKGVSIPQLGSVMPLGGGSDIVVGGKADVYLGDREPFEVEILAVGHLGGYLAMQCKTVTTGARIQRGDSGSPIVQNGIIIGFIRGGGGLYPRYLYAGVAIDMYYELESFLVGPLSMVEVVADVSESKQLVSGRGYLNGR